MIYFVHPERPTDSDDHVATFVFILRMLWSTTSNRPVVRPRTWTDR